MALDLTGVGWRHWSLTARLMAGSGAALVLSAAVLVYVSVRAEVDEQHTTLRERVSDEIEFMMPTITEQAVVGDYTVIERLLTLRVKREDIDRLSWTDEQGNKIEATSDPVPREAPEWFIRWVNIPMLERVQDVSVGGVRYGKLALVLTPLPATNRLWSGLLEKLQIFTLGVGVFFAVIIQILSGGLKPLYRLATGAQKFGQGDYSVRLPAEGAPEMLESIKAFNSMADSIEQLVTSLRESEARKRLLATIVEQSDEAIFTVDLNAFITSWNAAAEDLFGYASDEIVGKEYGMIIPSEYREELDAPSRIRAGQKLSRETRLVTKNGTIVDIEISAAPMYDDYGVHTGEITIARNITERKRTQEQLLQAKRAAEAASRAKSDFVANMSHEIRTPMNGILGFTELVLDSNLTAEQRENLNAVKSSAESLLSVINDILDFSKIEAGRLDIEHIPFALRRSVAQTTKPLEMRASQKGLSLTWEIAPDVPDAIIGDPARLGQVIVNLVGNAIKFTSNGSVSLGATLEYRGDAEARLLFTVSDTGIGIPRDKQRLIFEAFSQADMSTTRVYGGTGLGLTIASRLVELMGGSITVESEPGRGSTFQFSIRVGLVEQPAGRISGGTRPFAAQPGLFAEPSHALARGLDILVAEDNPVNQKLAIRLLEKLGHRVHLVENGEQALETVKSSHFDVLLLDVQMPVMGGIAACGAIREWERTRGLHIPIVAMTAHAMQGDRERCLEAGMDEYISKPIDIAHLKSILQRLGSGAAAAEAVAEPMPASAHGDDKSLFDIDLALERVGDDRKLLCEIIGVFVKECPKSIAQIESAIQASEADNVARMAHRFKGSAVSIAAHHASSLALALESVGRNGDLRNAARLLAELKSETGRLLPALEATIDTLRGETASA